MTTDTPFPSPSLLRRLAAMVYDTLLVLPLIMASVALFMGIRSLLVGAPDHTEVLQLDANVVRLVELFTVVSFFSWFWIKNGQTLGMQAWRIRLVDFDGNRPAPGKCVLRCFAAALSAGCAGLGYLWCLVDRNGRYWHDYLSGTQLILLPKQQNTDKEQT